MIEPKQNRIVVLCGYRGSGKSTFAQTLLQRQENLAVYDPNEDDAYDWIPNTVHSLDRTGDPHSLTKYFEWARGKHARFSAVRYIPEEDEKGSLFDDANKFSGMIWNLHTNGIWVVFEEIHQIVQTASPASMPPQLRKIVNRGRHKRISMICTGLRFAEIPRPVTAGANLFVIFHTAEPLDVEELRRRIGAEATDEVMRLCRYEALVFDVGTRSYFVSDSKGNVLDDTQGGFSRERNTDLREGDIFRL
jgi:energy-coupling factor transporter ATP-binding protein EcfA2